MSKDVIGAYCYDLALSKVQFSSDTSKFSPNNVRRIFISGDGVLVQSFIDTGSGKFKQCTFNPTKAFNCFCDKGYKPIVQCLVDLVCSNLEEIVFCTKSSSGTNLNQAELNLSALLKGYSGSLSPDLSKSLLGRFPRFREIVMFNGLLSDVLSLTKDSNFGKSVKTFSDYISEKGLLYVQQLNNESWFAHHRLRPQHYLLDVQGGSLSKYFDSVKSAVEKSEKESKISEMNTKRFAEHQKNIDVRNQLATNMLVCLKRYANSSRKVDIDASKLLEGLSVPEELGTFCLSTEVLDVFKRARVDTSVKETAQKYELVISSLAKLSEACYLYTLNMFLDAVRSYEGKYALFLIKSRNFRIWNIRIPEGVNGYHDVELTMRSNFSKDASIKDSMAHLLAYTCKLNIPVSQIKDDDMYSVDYWRCILSRKETK